MVGCCSQKRKLHDALQHITNACSQSADCTCKMSVLHDQLSCTILLHQPCIEPCTVQEEDQNGETAGSEEEDEGIEAQPDEGGSREAGEEVVMLEQCLAWGGEQRQRCRLTMSVSGGSSTQAATPACSSRIYLLCVLPCTAIF